MHQCKLKLAARLCFPGLACFANRRGVPSCLFRSVRLGNSLSLSVAEPGRSFGWGAQPGCLADWAGLGMEEVREEGAPGPPAFAAHSSSPSFEVRQWQDGQCRAVVRMPGKCGHVLGLCPCKTRKCQGDSRPVVFSGLNQPVGAGETNKAQERRDRRPAFSYLEVCPSVSHFTLLC